MVLCSLLSRGGWTCVIIDHMDRGANGTFWNLAVVLSQERDLGVVQLQLTPVRSECKGDCCTLMVLKSITSSQKSTIHHILIARTVLDLL